MIGYIEKINKDIFVLYKLIANEGLSLFLLYENDLKIKQFYF